MRIESSKKVTRINGCSTNTSALASRAPDEAGSRNVCCQHGREANHMSAWPVLSSPGQADLGREDVTSEYRSATDSRLAAIRPSTLRDPASERPTVAALSRRQRVLSQALGLS
jgi:hypothetical protein